MYERPVYVPTEIRTPSIDASSHIRELQGEPFSPTQKLLEGAVVGAGLYLARDAYLQRRRAGQEAVIAALPANQQAAALAAQRSRNSRRKLWGLGLLVLGLFLTFGPTAESWFGTAGIVLGLVGIWKLIF